MTRQRPNIVFVMSDDHASHAISCYSGRINRTPNIDRIAEGGMRLDNCFCTNSICAPSRASILTCTYNHVNEVTTLASHMDNRQVTFPKLLRENGYQTAIVGKWHLGQGPRHHPTGFDYWSVLPGQGDYHNPTFIEMGEEKRVQGYVTDIITDKSIEWLSRRDRDKPFMLLCHHKAPHRSWEPDEKHADMYEDQDIPLPETFWDDYAGRPAAAVARMRMEHLHSGDLKVPVPAGLGEKEEIVWRYNRYIKDYLRVVASIDDNVGRLLDYLDTEGLSDNTIVVYTSDQGFFLGDHGWFDKRFMYEESLRMPFLIRYPRETAAGTTSADFVLNVDFAQTFLDYAGIDAPSHMQGASARSVFGESTPSQWQTAMYYRYWMHRDPSHDVYSHYGIRTHNHKLIFYYNDPLGQPGAGEGGQPPHWELFDLRTDPCEVHSVYGRPGYEDVTRELEEELLGLIHRVGDTPAPSHLEEKAGRDGAAAIREN